MKTALPLLLTLVAGCAGSRTECFDDCRPGAAVKEGEAPKDQPSAEPRTEASSPERAPPAGDARGDARSRDRAAIDAVLDDWHDAAARADEGRYFAHFAPDGVFLGTDATERWDAAAFRAFAHPHFAKGKAWTMRPSRRHVAVDGDHAWFDEALETTYGPCRGSGVLQRLGGAWKIAQYNLTLTIPNGRVAEVRELLSKPH